MNNYIGIYEKNLMDIKNIKDIYNELNNFNITLDAKYYRYIQDIDFLNRMIEDLIKNVNTINENLNRTI